MQFVGTMKEWMERGRELVAICTSIEITDKRPDLADDSISQGGWYGWQYGWRWLYTPGLYNKSGRPVYDPEMKCTRWTIPEAIFRHLPPSGDKATQDAVSSGRGIMPRWRGQEAAQNALYQACFAWARS